MDRKKRNTYLLIVGVIIILITGGYISYRKDMEARNNGVYTIAQVEKISIARSGWRVWVSIFHEQEEFHEDAVYFYQYFNFKSVGNRYFIKINYNKQERKINSIRLIPIIQVPDSIQSAPSDGWNEEWMKEHYPRVVEYVHDTR